MLIRLKEKFFFLFEKAASGAHSAGLTPDALTFLGLLSAAVSATFFLRGYPLFAAFFILTSGFFDAVDGAMAEMYREKTKFGALLDSTVDRISDALIISSIIIAGYCDIAWGLIALVASFLVSYTRARAESLGVEMGGVGLVERPERILILSATGFLHAVWKESIHYGIIVVAALSIVTILQRIRFCRLSLSAE